MQRVKPRQKMENRHLWKARWTASHKSKKNYSWQVVTAGKSPKLVAYTRTGIFIDVIAVSSISLWDNQRKKPVFTYNEAHGTFTNGSEYSLQTEAAYPITALASLRYSDLFVSGSHDGYVRFWKISSDNKQFEPIGSIPVQGFINSLEIKTVFPSNRTLLIVGVGQEPRYGRWMRLKKAKNCIKVIELPH